MKYYGDIFRPNILEVTKDNVRERFSRIYIICKVPVYAYRGRINYSFHNVAKLYVSNRKVSRNIPNITMETSIHRKFLEGKKNGKTKQCVLCFWKRNTDVEGGS